LVEVHGNISGIQFGIYWKTNVAKKNDILS
jgi:hypothetical protein